MKILYVHGFGAQFDPGHPKIKLLEQLGEVVGSTVNYSKGHESVISQLRDELVTVDIAVGNSMGGHAVASWAHLENRPWVAVNTVLQPSLTMQQWIGVSHDNHGHSVSLSDFVVQSYPDCEPAGFGCFLADSGDQIQSAAQLNNTLGDAWPVHLFSGGNHSFKHMEQALPLIKSHYQSWVDNQAEHC